ncbi:hypothetical protein AVEN_244435-1 [Araneus ventricosus]|uniref:Uncharacterized protein n=1 Tax=Araneus ventricosus TaxID=182803 RepID=A0A4Y2QUB7_ARAVE|nr:hypothetical protein AVEN_244435-1 [Araneus ventricosus]
MYGQACICRFMSGPRLRGFLLKKETSLSAQDIPEKVTPTPQTKRIDPLVIRFRLRDLKVLGSKSDSTKDPPVCRPAAKSGVKGQTSSLWNTVEVCSDRVPTQEYFSSSDLDSKLRVQSRNILCLASKRDVNITKPPLVLMYD